MKTYIVELTNKQRRFVLTSITFATSFTPEPAKANAHALRDSIHAALGTDRCSECNRIFLLEDLDRCDDVLCHECGGSRQPSNEEVERGSDGYGDFERGGTDDTPAFQRGHPVELD